MSNLTIYNKQAHEKAAQDAGFYTLNQLQLFYKRASLGFLLAAIASFALSSFYIAQYLAGADFGTLADWTFMQVLYAAIGFCMAAALTFGEIVLFNSGKMREFAALALFSMAFSVFAEVASTMQREAVAVSTKSQASGVYQASLKAANSLAAAGSTSSPVQLQIAKYSDYLAQLHQQNASPSEIKQIERVLLNLQNQNTTELNSRTALLSSTLQTAEKLEYNERNHQQIIILMHELFNISYTQANAILAIALIITFKWMFSYLGNMKQRSERAIKIKNGTLGVTLESAYSQLGKSAPVHQLGDENSAGMGVARIEPCEESTRAHDLDTTRMEQLYLIAKDTNANEVVKCPVCETEFKKRMKSHCFCQSKHKDLFWNTVKPERLNRLKIDE
jgi:hypothetical protein